MSYGVCSNIKFCVPSILLCNVLMNVLQKCVTISMLCSSGAAEDGEQEEGWFLRQEVLHSGDGDRGKGEAGVRRAARAGVGVGRAGRQGRRPTATSPAKYGGAARPPRQGTEVSFPAIAGFACILDASWLRRHRPCHGRSLPPPHPVAATRR